MTGKKPLTSNLVQPQRRESYLLRYNKLERVLGEIVLDPEKSRKVVAASSPIGKRTLDQEGTPDLEFWCNPKDGRGDQ